MMNNDNSINVETKLFGYIAENAQSSQFSNQANQLFKQDKINSMVIPMNIKFDDLFFTIAQMRHSKLSGAIISREFQEEVFCILDDMTDQVKDNGYCDVVYVSNGKLIGDLLMPRALEKYAESGKFNEDIGLMSHVYYFYETIKGEGNE